MKSIDNMLSTHFSHIYNKLWKQLYNEHDGKIRGKLSIPIGSRLWSPIYNQLKKETNV